MFLHPRIAHESLKAYFHLGLFVIENSQVFGTDKGNAATSKFSTIRNITFQAHHRYVAYYNRTNAAAVHDLSVEEPTLGQLN